MSLTDDRILQLKDEISALKAQLEQVQGSKLPVKALNNLFAHGREVVFCAMNDERLTVTEISDSISAYGYLPEEFLSGKIGWRDVLHPDDHKSLTECIASEIAKGEVSIEHEHRVFTKSGEVVWITCVSMPEIDAAGKVKNFLVKIKDISRRKQYEEKLQDVNENLFVTLKSIGEAVIQTNAEGYIDRLNGAAEKMAGIINLKAKGKSLNDVMRFSFDPDFSALVNPLKMKVESCKMVQIDEIFMKCAAEDKILRVSCNVSPIFIGKNKSVPAGYVLVVKDLTAIYNMLQAAQESEARMQKSESTIRGIFDHSADGMLLVDKYGIVREWSSGYERISGLSKDTVIGKYLWEVAVMGFPPEIQTSEECEKWETELKELVGNMRQKMIVRHVKHQKTGEHRILNILYFPVAMPDGIMLGGISRDVTEEVRSRELIEENEQKITTEKERLQALGDNMPNGCLYRTVTNPVTMDVKFVYLSGTFEHILNMSAETALQDFSAVTARIHPDDLPVMMRNIVEAAQNRTDYNEEVRFYYNDTDIRWIQISSHPHIEDGMLVYDGFILDVTDRKRAEREMITEKERLEALGDNMPDGCLFRFMMNTQPRKVLGFTYLSRTWELMSGILVENTLADFESTLAKVHPDDLPKYFQSIEESAANLSKLTYEFRFRRDDGYTVWLKASSSPRMEEDMVVWDGFIVDITERKLSEQALIAEKDRLQALGDYFPNGCLFRFKFDDVNRKFSFSYLSKTWEKLSNVTLEDALYDIEIPLSKIHPDDRGPLVEQIWETFDNRQENFDTELRFFYTPDELRWVQISTHRHYENGQPVSDGFILDITDRKNADRQLIAEKERLEALGNNLPGGSLFRFRSRNLREYMAFDYVSATWEQTTGVSAEDTLQNFAAVFGRVHPEDVVAMMGKLDESAIQMANLDTEARYLHPDGSVRWLHIASHPHYEDEFVVSDGYLIDVTERRVAEEKLAAEQAKLKSLTDNIPNGCLCQFAINPQTRTMWMAYMGENWERILNSPVEASKEDTNDIFSKVHEADLPGFMTEVIRTTMEMVPFNVEVRYWYTENDLRWLQVSGAPHHEGDLIIFDGMVMDITDRKKADQLLLAEKERVETLGNNLPNGALFRFKTYHETQVMSFEYVSATWERTTGVSAEDTLEDVTAVMSRIHPDDMPGLGVQLYNSCVDMSNVDAEARYLHPDGSLRWMHLATHPHIEDGAVVSDGFLLDITDRKRAERELFTEKERLQALGDNMPNGTLFRFKIDLQTQEMSFDYLSGTWEKMSGVSVEDTLANIESIFAYVHPDDLARLSESINTSVQTLENIGTEIRYLHPDGSQRWYQLSSHPHREDGVVYSDGFILDITARKNAENALFAEKERLQALGDNFPDGTLFRFKMDMLTEEMSFDYVSGTWEKTLGVSAGASLADIRTIFTNILPDDLPLLMQRIRESVTTLENIDTEVRYIHPVSRVEQWYQISSHPHREGYAVYSDGFILDITARKTAEQELRSEKDRLETLGNNIPGGCLYRFSFDPATGSMKMLYVSATWGEVTGVPSSKAMGDIATVFERVYPEDYLLMVELMQENMNTMSNFNMELRFLLNDETRWVQLTSRPHLEDNLVIWDGILLDITWRKEAERKLIAEKDRLEAVGNNLPEGSLYRLIFDRDTDKMYMEYVSATWETVTGLTPESITEDMAPFFAIVHPDDVDRLAKASDTSRDNLTNSNVEIRLNNKGNWRWIQIASHPHAEGSKVVWDGIMTDITRRKEAERELETEKDRLQALGDNFPNGCLFRFVFDIRTQKMTIAYLSETWETLTEIPKEEAMADVNAAFRQIVPEDLPIYMRAVKESVANLSRFNVEIRYQCNDIIKWIQISSQPRMEEIGIVCDGFMLDVTERKNIETELAVYREELERLVKERTEELEATNEELYATNEELYATNEEFAVTNEELHTKNDQLRNEIAARMEVMKKLEDSESKVRNFIRQSFEGIMMLDNEGRIIEWNEALERITGVSHDEALGNYEWELLKNYLPEEDRRPEAFEKLRQSRMKYIRGGREQEPTIEESVLQLPGGTKRYLQISMFPIGLAETCFFGRVLRDITEQKLSYMELLQYRTQLELMFEQKTQEVVAQQERLVSLSNNLPGGVIYQMMDRSMTNSWFTYISGYFVDMFEIEAEDAMADISLFHDSIYHEDQTKLIEFYNKDESQSNIDVEYRIMTKSGKLKWIHMRSSHHSTDDGVRIWDGFMIDITARKLAEQELEDTRRRQAILIKVLQIVQSAENLPDALSMSLAEMGKYTGVSRVYIFEKSADGITISNTYEWCNEGIEPAIDGLQNVPVEYMQQWFDVFDSGSFICTSDINTLGSETAEVLATQGIKSIVVLPLSANGIDYGCVGFDECTANKEWDENDVEMLRSLSQIISTTTRRHQAETAMQLSQQTMRTVLDNVDANIYVADFDSWNILFANKKIKELMGDDIEGKTCWKVLQEGQTKPCEFCPNPKLLNEKNHPTGLYRWEHWNENAKKWYECTDTAIEWVDGRLVHMEYATDVTDRKAAEEAVRQSEEMYRQLTVASPDAIVVCDPSGHIRYVSSKALELFGVEENADVSGLRIPQFVHSHDRRQAYSLFGNLLEDNISFVPQLLLVRKNGSEFFGEISSALVKDISGYATSVIMVIRDVTQRKLSEMELIRAKERAEESDKLKSAFLANMSHEIRTPLNGIVGFLNFLNSDTLSPRRRQEYINVINNSSSQLVKLIDDIIDVAKIEAKQMNIRPVPFRVNDLMNELQMFFETYLRANNKERIALILDDSGFIDSCVTYVDPMRLRQVLDNLIGNAIKFTEKGFIRFGYRQSVSGMLEFAVEDSGIGLAKSQLEVIFERFRQAELSNSRQYGGTGLGLTISRSLVQLMGGDMRVEAIEGAGSSFYFTIMYLPIAQEDERFFEEWSDETSLGGQLFENKVVLVVEPEIMKYKLYECLLSAMGFTVYSAENLQQWIEFITQTNHVDVVIANVSVFKGVDSEDIKQIKSVRAGLPTILAVPGKSGNYQQIIRDSQCNMILDEPVSYEKIVGAMRRFIR